MSGDGTPKSGSPAGVGSNRLRATAPGPSARASGAPRAMPRRAPASAACEGRLRQQGASMRGKHLGHWGCAVVAALGVGLAAGGAAAQPAPAAPTPAAPAPTAPAAPAPAAEKPLAESLTGMARAEHG